ncbi:52K [Murine mastadenovirus A]|uniref:52,55K n=1 Tax=Murine adenovirus A serotype 1 TaxID=10530 RepID=O10437_ADEM1|nr:52,55K [Murine mastadenovirus A]AP_000344.1 52K [Murine mastadenovirus A]AAB53752.1 52,55K [Murine adenovirus 1]
MHPVLRQMLPSKQPGPSTPSDPAWIPPEGEGIARQLPATAAEGGRDPVACHPRVQLQQDMSESFVPAQNVLREDHSQGRGEPEGSRHLRFQAGQHLHLNPDTVLSGKDFDPSEESMAAGPALSKGHAHVRAADLLTAYEQTVRQEQNFQQTFNNTIRCLLAREETTWGLMHLWDFAQALQRGPESPALRAQLFLVAQHCRDEGVFRESILNLGASESRWLLDLINLLQSIVVQERRLALEDKVAAINYAVLSLGKHYARKIFRTAFVPVDKELKITTFYMRMVKKALVLAQELGVYRNVRLQRVVSAQRKKEMSDQELMQQLRWALTDRSEEEKTLALPAAESEDEEEGEREWSSDFTF